MYRIGDSCLSVCASVNYCSPQVPVIAGLEQKALELMSRRAERLMERRRQDVRDQAEEVAMQASQYLSHYLTTHFYYFVIQVCQNIVTISLYSSSSLLVIIIIF